MKKLPNEIFIEEHPEVDVGALIFLYYAHTGIDRADSLEEIFYHAHGKDGNGGCQQFRNELEKAKSLKRWET